VQVGADDDVHAISAARNDGAEPVEKCRIGLHRSRLMGADTGVDHDRGVGRLDQEAVTRQEEASLVFGEEGSRPCTGCVDLFLGELGEEHPRRELGDALDDPGHRDRPDAPMQHGLVAQMEGGLTGCVHGRRTYSVAVNDVRLAGPEDRPRIVATVVAAFDQDPAFRAFFGNGADFADLARVYVEASATRRIAVGGVWLGAGGDAVALWSPPVGSADAPSVVADLPADVAARLAVYDGAVGQAIPSAPHWYLGMLASHPARRGEGLARRVAEPGLAAARADGVPAVLETTNPANVVMYERSGWRVIAEATDVLGLDVWVLQAE